MKESSITIYTEENADLTDPFIVEVNLSLHGANRFLERDIPLEAVEGVRYLLPLLNEKPLKFRYKGVQVVARLVDGYWRCNKLNLLLSTLWGRRLPLGGIRP